MVVVGSDVHKRTHTFVAVDEVGRKLAEITVKADHTGHDRAIRWARERFGEVSRWAVEDCRHLSARLEIDLLEAGEQVVRVPPKLMAEQRRLARTRGKSDPIDALAVARLRWHLHRIAPGDPAADPAPGSLDVAKTRRALTAWLATELAARPSIDARLARDVLADIDRICVQVSALDKEITTAVQAHEAATRLTQLPGCGALTAAKIVGETARVERFADEARYAMHAGVAPIPVWSGRTKGKVRVSRTGNRQLNAALHRIAITQLRWHDPAKAYYAKRLAAGDTRTEAIRRLKRRLARTVFNTLKTNPSTAARALPAAA